jgi:hypothetical protein
MEPRAKTAEEVRQEVIEYLAGMAEYWDSMPNKTSKEKLDGLVFSFFTMLDGVTSLPAFDLVLRPHENDKEFFISEGENWYEPGMIVNDCMMHEIYR